MEETRQCLCSLGGLDLPSAVVVRNIPSAQLIECGQGLSTEYVRRLGKGAGCRRSLAKVTCPRFSHAVSISCYKPHPDDGRKHLRLRMQ
jgi:hypothetical protein